MAGVEAFLPMYPDPADPQFSYELYRKREFYETRLEPSEEKPTEQGMLLQDQLFMKRFVSEHTPYDRCLLFRGVGTGKTCVSSAVAENFKDVLVGGSKRRPALVFVKNRDLARAYQDEIVRVCTAKDTYYPQLSKYEESRKEKGYPITLTEDAKQRRLRSMLSKTYELHTYDAFLDKLNVTEEALSNYSNRVIFLDEAHHIHPVTAEEGGRYEKMHQLLHGVTGCRILVATGSPIWDNVHEIASLANLILDSDSQLPTGTRFIKKYFDKRDKLKNEDALVRAFRGIYISFMRAMSTTARRIEEGVTTPWMEMTKVYPDAMAPFQAAVVEEASTKAVQIEMRRQGKTITREQVGGAALRDARDASNCVYPEFKEDGTVKGAYGKSAFKKHFEMKVGGKKDYRFKDARVLNAFKNDLSTYSAKFAAIIDDIVAHPKDPVFVYTGEFVTNAGAILFSLCLGLRTGYVRAKTSHSIKTPDTKTRRYVVFTANDWTTNSAAEIQSMIAIINRPENRYADHCQVVIASQKLGLGFTFKRFRRFHSLVPHWNPPSRDQSEGRVLRFGSHDDLPDTEREVRVFSHVAVERGKQQKGKGYPKDAGFSDKVTTDIHVSHLSEVKEKRNVQIYRVLKRVAFDCPFNYKRNVLVQDVDGSRPCEYGECNYECVGFPVEHIDKSGRVWEYKLPAGALDSSSYDEYYTEPAVRTLIHDIQELFSVHFNLELGVIVDLVEGDRNIVLRALDHIVVNRVPIRNRYGFVSYLKEDGNIFFLDDNVNLDARYLNSTYNSQLFVVEELDFDHVTEIAQLEQGRDLMEEACQRPESLSKLNTRTQILLFESLWAKENAGTLTVTERKYLRSLIRLLDADVLEVEGAVYHILFRINYSDLEKYIPPFMTRTYDAVRQRWEFVSSAEMEAKVVVAFKTKLSQREEEMAAKYRVYGIMKDGEFYFRDQDARGSEGGRKCVNYPITTLIDTARKLGFKPRFEEEDYEAFKRKSRKVLLEEIQNRNRLRQPAYRKYLDEIPSLDMEQLRDLRLFLFLDKAQLCAQLQDNMERSDMMIVY